jgi:amyloid beta precursor protein binding protein 1
MTTATTSDKEQKYDRQLRLWGAQGQALLEGARVLLLTGDGAGSETLKNVVLPAIGSFAVLDDARVTSRDLADNFFVDAAHLGAPRAECVAALLGELNTDVAGRAIVRAVADVDEALLAEFSFVIACNVAPSELQRIAALLWARATPLVVVRTCGFLGVVRIAVPEHIVVETKIDNAADDLRVSDPFPELLAYATATPLDALDQQTRSHVPWICILVQFAVQWRAEHGGALPTSTADRKLFKQAVRNLAKTPQEENFPEAFNQAHTAYTPYRLPADVRAILDRASADKARALPLVAGAPAHAPAVFWRIMAGVAAFVAGEGAGKLPLAGVVPDLTATTSGFLALQTLYADKARRDADAVYAHIEKLFGAADAAAVGRDNVREVCRNCAQLQHFVYRSLAQELADPRRSRPRSPIRRPTRTGSLCCAPPTPAPPRSPPPPRTTPSSPFCARPRRALSAATRQGPATTACSTGCASPTCSCTTLAP